jgi:hypothetical protein
LVPLLVPPKAVLGLSLLVPRAVRGCEAHEKLQNRVEGKDREPNEVLLVTCGLVDERGYACGIDRFIYRTLEEAAQAEKLSLEPQSLRAVVMHLWGSPYWLELYRAENEAMPWTP